MTAVLLIVLAGVVAWQLLWMAGPWTLMPLCLGLIGVGLGIVVFMIGGGLAAVLGLLLALVAVVGAVLFAVLALPLAALALFVAVLVGAAPLLLPLALLLVLVWVLARVSSGTSRANRTSIV